jgi:large subunit ribosomal protein L15
VKLHELQPAPNSRKSRTRVGRGISAGQGKTSGRGQKGQGSRSSVSLPKGFEGGQMRLSQRLPKLRGFHNRWKKEYAVVNLGKLNRFESGSVVDAETLKAAGLIGPARDGVKLLAAGALSRKLTVRVARASAAARAAVEAAGGTVELLGAPAAAAATPEASAPVAEPEPAAVEEAPEPKPARARRPKAEPVPELEAAVEEELPSPAAADDADAESDEE